MSRRGPRPPYPSHAVVTGWALRQWRQAWDPWRSSADVMGGLLPGVLLVEPVGHLLLVWRLAHPGPGDPQYQRGWQTAFLCELGAMERPVLAGLWYFQRRGRADGGFTDSERARYAEDLRRLRAAAPGPYVSDLVLVTGERQPYGPPVMRGLLEADGRWRDVVVQVEPEARR